MKSMKKLVTLLLSLVMLCALALPAMAEGDGNYSITINGAVAGHTYTAYQVFSGDYFYGDGNNNTEKNKEYLSNVVWGKDVDGTAILNELKTNETLKDKFTGVDASDGYAAEKVAYILQGLGDKSEELDEFARVVSHHLSTTENSGEVTINQDGTNKITPLAAGYYFVKDTGEIGGNEIATKFLVKVVGDAKVTVKAQAPEFKKEIVKDNVTDNNKGTSVNVGDPVKFRLTANVPDMASFDKYTFTMHDTLSEGLTFNKDSVKVTVNGTLIENTADTSNKYTLTYPTVEGSEDTFTITFTETQLKNLVKHTGDTDEDPKFGATIVVEYTATLNDKALNKDVETNKAHLEYTNNPSGNGTGIGKTPEVPVYVYDFDLTVDKFDGTNQTGQNPATTKKLKGAKFVLYRKVTTDGTEKDEYYYWNKTDKKVDWVGNVGEASVVTTDDNGAATFNGLAAGTYYLKETKAPDGYNTQKEDAKVEIKAVYNTDGTLKADADGCKLQHGAEGKHYYQVESIANKAGAVLPSTGGIGTTIFYVLGSILALGAAVLLIAKKRMNGQDR